MSDYTPTTEEVRMSLCGDDTVRRTMLDRWLTEHDREVAERAWDKGFDAGERDVFEHDTKGNWDEPHACIQNPYRAVSK